MNKTSGIYLAIIGSLSIHVLVLIVLNLMHPLSKTSPVIEQVSEIMELDFVEVQEDVEIDQSEMDYEALFDQEIKDLIANMDAERSSEARSYNYQNNAQLREAVEERMRALEEQMFDEAHEENNICPDTHY